MPADSDLRKKGFPNGAQVALEAFAMQKFVPHDCHCVPGKQRLRAALSVVLKHFQQRRKADLMLDRLIRKVVLQEKIVGLAEYWLEDPRALIIPKRKQVYGLEAERERFHEAQKAVKRFHFYAYYFLGAFLKRDPSATAYFTLELERAISDLDELVLSAHAKFIAERRLDPEAINHRERRPETIVRNDAIERVGREFIHQESVRAVQTVRLEAEIARYVREQCDAARKLSYSKIIGILEQRRVI